MKINKETIEENINRGGNIFWYLAGIITMIGIQTIGWGIETIIRRMGQ